MELKEYPSDQEGVVLYQTTISDTGIGMSKEFLPHIFDEFAREQTSTVHKIKGTGLGMPIVKRLVELMNGTITVTSEQGKGTSFVVTIPMKITDQTAEEHNSVVADTGKFKGKMILLAEDIEVNAEIACAILGEAGFSIEVAENGSRCVDMLKSMPAGYYDLVLMDIQMPIMNGYEATRTIRNLEEPEKRDIPIIAMTANALKQVGSVKIILAHMGGWKNWQEVAENLSDTSAMLDTAFSLGEITPKDDYYSPDFLSLLKKQDFVRLVNIFGSERVLFGTDSPWTDQEESLKKIKELPFSEADLENIIYLNAKKLLGL